MFADKVEYFDDADGNRVRKWKPEEASSYTNDMMRAALSNRVAVVTNELLGHVPPSAIKYMVTKGLLLPRGADLYFVTRRAAVDLDLPLRFKGGQNAGRKVPFADPPAARPRM